MDYYREAFTMDYNHVRITFDSQLRKSTEIEAFADRNIRTVPVLDKAYVILEIKYNNFFLRGLAVYSAYRVL